ncbi:TonB-dependent receptor plug domain-containing protein [Methylomonas sp. CM2]|uniref:TonB-dependent receptor plug domain-containing protein n=1 Tax=Methylomonas sp. CM2 TaxID=3417647 RepID=UPI003CE6F75D
MPLSHIIARARLLLLLAVTAEPTHGEEAISELKSLSLQALSSSTVAIAAKRSQAVGETPSAVFVVNQEEIRRSGLQSIPEILRRVPGLEVARVDGNHWAITSRGFNGLYANKLLVMVDGRTVYDPLNSGVFWNEQDYPLEDIDRIEVIRGPAATMWGSNAVNGVINIVTRSAQETQGTLVSTGTSQEEPGFVSVRYGGKLDNDLHYRVYGKYNHRDRLHLNGGDLAYDALDIGRAGFRSDWSLDARHSLIAQGDYYNGNTDQTLSNPLDGMSISADPGKSYGGNLLLRWQQALADDARLQIRGYFDHATRDQSLLDYSRDSLDLDMQHDFPWHDHLLTWGAGYRYVGDMLQLKSPSLTICPTHRDRHWFNLFAQDEWRLLAEELRLVLGGRLEHNDFSGYQLQPSARLLWQPAPHHSAWAGVSRAVRVPTRVEHDLNTFFSLGAGTTANIRGNPNLAAETVVNYEIGYRFFPNSAFSLDTTLFYGDYSRLTTTEPLDPINGNRTITIPLLIDNQAYGETYGWESAVNWRPAQSWRLQASYSLFGMALHKRPASLDSAAEAAETASPSNRFNISSYLNLPHQLELDLHWYYTGRLRSQIDGYHRFDARLGWQPNLHLELALGAQNLLDNRHLEFAPSPDNALVASEIERNFYLKATVRY